MTRSRTSQVAHSDHGAIAVLVAILGLVLFGLAAFVTDFGLAYNRQRQLQIASDGAALAGAKELLDAATPELSCAAVLTKAMGSADKVARDYAIANAPRDSELAPGDDPPEGWLGDAAVAFRCNPDQIAEVRVATTNLSPAFFGSLFGASGYALSRPATAAMGPGSSFTGLRPFSFCYNFVKPLLDAAPGTAHFLSIDKVWNAKSPTGLETELCPGATEAGGNWGVLGLDGGAEGINPKGSNQPTPVTLWTDVGYNSPLDLSGGLVLPGNPGFPNPNAGSCDEADGCLPHSKKIKTGEALDDIMGRTVLFPVWDSQVGKGGDNADFNIVGVVSAKLCGWKLGNERSVTPDPQHGGPSCYVDTPASVRVPAKGSKVDGFQLVLDPGFIPIGTLSSACGLDPSKPCSKNPRVTQLID